MRGQPLQPLLPRPQVRRGSQAMGPIVPRATCHVLRADVLDVLTCRGLRAHVLDLPRAGCGRAPRAACLVQPRRSKIPKFRAIQSGHMSSIQATRMKKGMLMKIGEDLFRVLELQHVTPGNLRGFVRVKFRNIRNGSLSDQKLRSEDSWSARRWTSGRCSISTRTATRSISWTPTATSSCTSRSRSAGRLGELPRPRLAHQSGVLRQPSRSASSCRRRWISRSRTPPPASRARPPARRSSRRGSRPASSCRCRRS